MNEKEKREYYIVDKRILPNSIQSVIKVNDLVQHSKISKYEAIKKVVDEVNLTRDYIDEIEVFSPHCFRHTFATRCFESCIQPKTVQAYLGHASLQMTMDLYTSVMPKHMSINIKSHQGGRIISAPTKLAAEALG